MIALETPITADLVRGALELEATEHGLLPHRLPARARAQCTDGQLAMAEAQPAGVRLAFRTMATVVELDTLRTRVGYQGMPLRPDGVYDLLVDGELVAQASTTDGKVLLLDMATGTAQTRPGAAGTVRFDGLPDREKDVEVWLPHNEITELVSLRTDAPVAALPRGDRRVWLHHGSSISHGSNAASPSTTWPALVATTRGLELINLGFSGSMLLDPFVARTMRDTEADLISLKIGINLVNADLMRPRAFGPAVHGFLDTIRDGHPTTPLLVVSAILCPIHEETPGPGAVDLSDGTPRFRATGDPADPGKLTLRVIREELARIVAQRQAEDPYLHYLDGRDLYGEADFADSPLPDQLHPDAATHRLIADRFAKSADSLVSDEAVYPEGARSVAGLATHDSFSVVSGKTGYRRPQHSRDPESAHSWHAVGTMASVVGTTASVVGTTDVVAGFYCISASPSTREWQGRL